MRQLTDARDTASRQFARADDQAFAMRSRLREIEGLALRDSVELRAAETRDHYARQNMEAYWERYVSQVLAENPAWMEAVRRRDNTAQAVSQAGAAFAASRRQAAATQVRPTGAYGSRSGGYRGGSRSSGRGNSRSNRSSYR